MLLGGLWHGAALRFLLWGGLHGLYLVVHRSWQRLGFALPVLIAWPLTIFSVILAWVPFRAAGFGAALAFYRGLFGLNGIAIPAIYIKLMPQLGAFGHPVQVLPYLGDARTLSLLQATLFLLLGWFIVLLLPELHEMSCARRSVALTASFAFSLQALFFAPSTVPFLYFQF